ncbi:YfcC family protein [Pseudomarimonas salicorniae]|uniref:TIGR00366 family protein n=1 Tax=Pseudomarimonas salicorniae TaxID=2933270 RepID=A0ABT0GFN7_9GAMM|nr:TIGR00366 family protein [Lysobacter sp. CAU 1642]MCK7593351.1 TIGR00366 family protein [Lysobacter sp. CAU 1642]
MASRLRMPHTLVLLFAIMVLAWAATWLLPQGQFQTAEDEKGHALVVPGTYTAAAERVQLSPLVLFTAVPRAMAASADIIFFVLIVGGAVAVMRATGVVDAVLGSLLRRVGHSPGLLVIIGMGAFAAGSSAIGVAEEYIPFAAMLVSLCLAMRMDAMVAMGILIGGYGIGYGVAALNPFTVQVAQGVAGVPPTSGIAFRLALFLPFLAIGVHHVWRYAQKVKADPASSLMHGIEPRHAPPPEYPALGGRLLLVFGVLTAALALMVWGIAAQGWYLVELGALFIGLSLVVGLLGGLGANGTALRFGEGASELATTAVLIGFARSIALILEEGQVLHTVVNGLAGPLNLVGAHAAAVGMMLIQTLINFFIPSGSGQAFVTMPIMAPLGDLVGVSRQVSVLAYQFGDGLSNMLVPTNIVLMSILGVAGVPYDRWFRFAAPLLLKLVVAAALAMVTAVAIGYQ